VPVLAPGFADVLVIDPDPLVGGRIDGHLLDQLAVLLLDVGDVVEAALDVLEAGGQGVANALELVHREESRPAHSGNTEVDALARKRRAEQPGERELHRGDLTA
jgi:hypothetical protein